MMDVVTFINVVTFPYSIPIVLAKLILAAVMTGDMGLQPMSTSIRAISGDVEVNQERSPGGSNEIPALDSHPSLVRLSKLRVEYVSERC
jgi:hypothetical protein